MKVSPTLAAVGIAILSFFSPRALALNNQDSPEQILFQSANRERAARGLPTLAWNAALAEAAWQHALRLARTKTLWHKLPAGRTVAPRAGLPAPRFTPVPEKVAAGPRRRTWQGQGRKH